MREWVVKILIWRRRIVGFAVLAFLFYSSKAYAFFGINAAIQNGISQGITAFLDNITGQVIQAATGLLQWLVFSPTNLAAIPDFQTLLTWVEGIATAWAIVLTMKDVNVNSFDPEGRSPNQVVRGLVMAIVAIYVTPLMVEFAITVNNGLCALILSFPLGSQLSDNKVLNAMGSAIIQVGAGTALTGVNGAFGTLGSLFGTYTFVLSLALIVIAIALVIVAINNGIRFIELLFLIAIAPLLAASKVTGGELFDVWGRELIAVVFSEAVQLFSIHFGLAFLINPYFANTLQGPSAVAGVVIGLGGMIFAVRGPKTLRMILYRGTTGGGGMQMAGQVAMRAIAVAAIPK